MERLAADGSRRGPAAWGRGGRQSGDWCSVPALSWASSSGDRGTACATFPDADLEPVISTSGVPKAETGLRRGSGFKRALGLHPLRHLFRPFGEGRHLGGGLSPCLPWTSPVPCRKVDRLFREDHKRLLPPNMLGVYTPSSLSPPQASRTA